MNVVAIMATCGRHTLAERSLRFFLDQDYEGEYTLIIFNNSNTSLRLDLSGTPKWDGTIDTERASYADLGNRGVHLVNQYIDSKTGEGYKNLGAIYNDIINHIGDDIDVVVHWDDDDIFLPNHISEGVKGLRKVIDENKVAYKPERSYYRHPGGIQLMGNNLEPSVFVKVGHIMKYKYSLTTSDQHMSWFQPLLSEGSIWVDPKGTPTLIYNWGDTEIPTFKTSGNAGSPNNFDNYRNFSQDHGDRVLTPWPKEDVQKYYNLIK